jgi:hypothetical protein
LQESTVGLLSVLSSQSGEDIPNNGHEADTAEETKLPINGWCPVGSGREEWGLPTEPFGSPAILD